MPGWVPVLAALLVLLLAFLLLWRSRAEPSRKEVAASSMTGGIPGAAVQLLDGQQDALDACREIMTRLSFRDSIDHEKFATVVLKSGEHLIESRLNLLTDGGNVALNSVQALRHGELVLRFSTKGQALINAGQLSIARDAAGRLLPQLKDATGQVREIGRVGGVAKVGKVANVAAAVVGAAHLIAGADISKRLKSMDTKIDALLAGRRIDQFARLERVFTSAKELLALSETRNVSSELWRLRGDLRELRSIWRHECENMVAQIDGNRGWFERQATADQRVLTSLSDAEQHTYWIEYALRLDRILASASGTWEAYEAGLADEMKNLDDLRTKFEEKQASIQDDKLKASLPPQTSIAEIVSSYRDMLPLALPAPTPVVV